MSGIELYSKTASSNNSATPNGWPEGQAPSTVNDCGRQMMAAIRTWYEDAEWTLWGDTTAYVSGTQFKIAGSDVTGRYSVGRRVRAVGSSTGTIYGKISVSSFSTDTTVTVVWDSGSLSNETLTISIATIKGGTSKQSIDASGITGISGTYAPLASPTFTGTPAAPTASVATNTTQIATTAFVLANSAAQGVLVGVQVFTSGGTYTPTSGASKVLVVGVGGGGGSGGSGSGGNGGDGGTTSFGSLLSLGGGKGSVTGSNAPMGGAGGTPTAGTFTFQGAPGTNGTINASTGNDSPGGTGGGGLFGAGAGQGGKNSVLAAQAGATNSGGGGGGASGVNATTNSTGGGGGGAQGWYYGAASSQTVTIGTAGSAGTAGTLAGAAGGTGIVVVFEYR